MKKHLFHTLGLLGLVAVALAFAQPARAEDKPAKAAKADKAKPKSQQFTGMIESMDATAGTCTVKRSVKGKDGAPAKEESKTFKCAADCKAVDKDGNAAKMTDFKVGDKVVVMFTDEGGDAMCHKMAAWKPAPKKDKPKAAAPAAPADK